MSFTQITSKDEDNFELEVDLERADLTFDTITGGIERFWVHMTKDEMWEVYLTFKDILLHDEKV